MVCLTAGFFHLTRCCKAETVGMIDHNGGDTVLTTDPAFTMANRRCDVAGESLAPLSVENMDG
jgi:hypothetical protein